MSNLKPCPCGKVPEKLDTSLGEDAHAVYHDHCPWFVVVYNDELTDEESEDPDYYDAWAVRAWNSAPRGNDHD